MSWSNGLRKRKTETELQYHLRDGINRLQTGEYYDDEAASVIAENNQQLADAIADGAETLGQFYEWRKANAKAYRVLRRPIDGSEPFYEYIYP